MADLIHKVLNLVIPPPSIATLLFLLPPYLFFKSLLALINSLFSENVAGKVVLITGAPLASGRKESQLVEVANSVYQLGSPDVIIIRADVSKVDDCQRFVDETVSHFGWLDHLVNNAGIALVSWFEDCHDITIYEQGQDRGCSLRCFIVALCPDSASTPYVEVSLLPIRSVKVVAEKIVNGACRGHGYLSEPEEEDPDRNAISKKILDWSGLKQYLYPTSVQFPDLLANKGSDLMIN
ncbi:hypothetical protein CDL15_Pgr014909 [Punica granatum]|uniref:Uncharacterized protein n=1 Tax=Punica granatum TaxID=22663 RepID=A0A218Y156_PUNGR|nr:hypothetical protein CDL15_Pgr014909 [Punica granatum]